MEFDKINIADLIVIVALALALFASIFYGYKELSMSIASGLLGYIGGTTKGGAGSVRKKEDGNIEKGNIS